jgi:RHS repeat-associated protein
MTAYTWDFENRLIGVDTNANGTNDVEYQYDAGGLQVALVANGDETRFLVDTNQRFAQVLEEYTPAGVLNVSYVFGNDLVSQDRNGNRSFYHADGIGSTRTLTDETGTTTDGYIYDAFGRTISQTGATENLYLFQGERFDPVLGQYYLRARHYDAATGRFTSTDPLAGFRESPMSLHRYLFVNANPVNFVDPGGKFLTLVEVSTGLSLRLKLESAFASAGEGVIVRAARIADKLIFPGVSMQEVGIELIVAGSPGGVHLYKAGRTLMALGLQGLALAASFFYEEAAENLAFSLFKFKGTGTTLGDAGIQFLEAKLKSVVKANLLIDADAAIDAYIKAAIKLVDAESFREFALSVNELGFEKRTKDLFKKGKILIATLKTGTSSDSADLANNVADLTNEVF